MDQNMLIIHQYHYRLRCLNHLCIMAKVKIVIP